MASIGGKTSGGADGRDAQGPEGPHPNVAELLQKLALTAEEEEMVAFSDDEDTDAAPAVEYALVGKVLSPTTVYASTILGAMRPAWGNPRGLRIRAIGEKGSNMFVAEFGDGRDRDRALAGSPWVVGKHAVILQNYDEKLKPSQISFERMEIWVRLINLPLGWMNSHRGTRAMSLIGEVIKLDVDEGGKASGPFLRARVGIDIAKPVRRGVLLKTDKNKPPEWFTVQYEKLPFFCKSCGVIGHSELVCSTPAQRNAQGKLPYDIALRTPEERRKKMQSLAEAAAESFGSGSSSNSRQPRDKSARSKEGRRSNSKGAGSGGNLALKGEVSQCRGEDGQGGE